MNSWQKPIIIAIAEAIELSYCSYAAWYAALEITRVAPAGAPSSTAEGNTEKVCTKDRQRLIASPCASSGIRMWIKRALAFAPKVAAACSKDGSMPVR